MIKTLIRPAVVLLALFTLVTGLFYPLAVTGLAQVVFPAQANGSLIEQRWPRRWLRVDRPVVRRSQVLLGPAFGDIAVPL